jgi:hypothetical protein
MGRLMTHADAVERYWRKRWIVERRCYGIGRMLDSPMQSVWEAEPERYRSHRAAKKAAWQVCGTVGGESYEGRPALDKPNPTKGLRNAR